MCLCACVCVYVCVTCMCVRVRVGVHRALSGIGERMNHQKRSARSPVPNRTPTQATPHAKRNKSEHSEDGEDDEVMEASLVNQLFTDSEQ